MGDRVVDVMEAHKLIGDTRTNKNGADTCDTDDCLNNYTPYNVDHDLLCVTCASERGVDVTQ